MKQMCVNDTNPHKRAQAASVWTEWRQSCITILFCWRSQMSNCCLTLSMSHDLLAVVFLDTFKPTLTENAWKCNKSIINSHTSDRYIVQILGKRENGPAGNTF